MIDAETSVISTEGMSSMITDSIVMIDIECQPLPRGVDHMCLDNRWTDALIVLGREFQSTPGNQALMQDPSLFKVWSTGTEPTERVMTEMYPPATECTSPDQSASAEPSKPW